MRYAIAEICQVCGSAPHTETLCFPPAAGQSHVWACQGGARWIARPIVKAAK
jgi:hypothetical protein